MKAYIGSVIQNTPKLLIVIYVVVSVILLYTVIKNGKQFWQSQYSTQSLYGCINRVSLVEGKADVHNIYVIDKFHNEVKLSVEGKMKALELKRHQYYCYDFDIYLFSPFIMGESQKFIAKVDGLKKEERTPTKFHLADYINRQLEKHAPAAGDPAN